MKAAQQPDKKNLNVFSEGVPRSHLIAEIGPPISSREFPDGRVEDIFKFRQGYSKEVRVGRALAHGAADLATGFIWELAGTPIEMIVDGTEVKAVVIYDGQSNVESIQILEGEKAFRSGPWGVRPNRNPYLTQPGTGHINRNPLSNPYLSSADQNSFQSALIRHKQVEVNDGAPHF